LLAGNVAAPNARFQLRAYSPRWYDKLDDDSSELQHACAGARIPTSEAAAGCTPRVQTTTPSSVICHMGTFMNGTAKNGGHGKLSVTQQTNEANMGGMIPP
jgi:hypothetical protein